MFGILSMVVAIVGLLLGWMAAKWLGIVITAISIVLAIIGLVKKEETWQRSTRQRRSSENDWKKSRNSGLP